MAVNSAFYSKIGGSSKHDIYPFSSPIDADCRPLRTAFVNRSEAKYDDDGSVRLRKKVIGEWYALIQRPYGSDEWLVRRSALKNTPRIERLRWRAQIKLWAAQTAFIEVFERGEKLGRVYIEETETAEAAFVEFNHGGASRRNVSTIRATQKRDNAVDKLASVSWTTPTPDEEVVGREYQKRLQLRDTCQERASKLDAILMASIMSHGKTPSPAYNPRSVSFVCYRIAINGRLYILTTSETGNDRHTLHRIWPTPADVYVEINETRGTS